MNVVNTISMDSELWEIVEQVMKRYRLKRSPAIAFIVNEYDRLTNHGNSPSVEEVNLKNV